MVLETDVLIIGAGVAGLSTAIKIAEQNKDSKILILTKTNKQESNTRWAQGGIAVVWDFDVDNFQKHIDDTLIAGDGLCNEEVVRIVVEEGHERVKEIIDWGARFDKEEGKYDLGMEGGHSEHRILHFKDITGWEILRSLIEKAETYPNITIQEHYFAIDIITQHHMGKIVTRLTPDIECYGTYALNKKTGEIDTILAKSTVMCSGGGGQVYRNTTNPTVATGDGMAMAYRANARLANMEFVQFHPTALFNPAGENPDFLISEAVRGEGAILRTVDGKTFMEKYDERLSLAPRDIVARAIDNEIKIRGDEYVYLDCSPIDKDTILHHFPTIYEKCKSIGIDILKGDMIPVLPACHYMCGGIHTDAYGRTSIANLYAAGECTNSGLHGANRLASNSLLEGLVFGNRVAESVNDSLATLALKQGIPNWNAKGTTDPKEMVLLTQSWKELKEIMSNYVGIVRTNVRLKRALDRLHLLYVETEKLYQETTLSPQLSELRNLITIAYLVTKGAQMRRESRGLHYNTDYPNHFDYLETTWM